MRDFMGLDFIPGCAHFTYSGFSFFRHFLAKSIGVDLDQMIGYGGNIPFSTVNHALVPLLDHSDSDDILTVEECKQVLPALKTILENNKEELGDYYNRGIDLCGSMQEAIDDGIPLEFC